jgi:hypothetical protein
MCEFVRECCDKAHRVAHVPWMVCDQYAVVGAAKRASGPLRRTLDERVSGYFRFRIVFLGLNRAGPVSHHGVVPSLLEHRFGERVAGLAGSSKELAGRHHQNPFAKLLVATGMP